MHSILYYFHHRIFPLLKDCKARITYYKVLYGSNGSFLRNINKTKSIFIHIPRTGGKSISNGIYNLNIHEGFGHASARFYQSIMGRSRYKKYFKFAFIRNPWDRAYSGFNFAKYGGFGLWEDNILEDKLRDLSFELFVKKWLPKQNLDKWTLFRPQFDYVSDFEDRLIIDRLCHFENMEHEFEYLVKRLNITADIPHINKSHRNRFYKDSYDNEMIEIIEKLYHKDIEKFGYNFDGRSLVTENQSIF